MVNRAFEFILSRSQWRNIFKNMLLHVSVLVYLLLVGIGVKGDITNDQQGNGTGTWHPYNAEAQQGPHEYNTPSFPQHNTASYPEYNTAHFPASYPGQYPNQDPNLKNNEYQRPYHHRQHNYRHQNYDNRPHYRQNFAKNGTETEYQPHQQRYQRRGHRQYHRDENAHDRQYDNGNYTTYYNDYNPYVPPDQHQYYYDPFYNQQNVAPPYGQQNYAYQPEQYYYSQPAVQSNDAFGYSDPQYDQQLNYHQQQYYNHQQQQPQQQYNQDFRETRNDGRQQFTPEAQSSISDASQSVSRRRTTVRRQKSKSTNTTESTIATQVTTRAGTAKTATTSKAATTATTAKTAKTATTAKTKKTTTSSSTFSVWNIRSDTPRQAYQQLQGLVHPFPQIHPNPQQWDPNHAEPYYAEPHYDPQIYAQYPTQYFPHIQSDHQQQQQQWNPYSEQFYPVNQSSSYPFPFHQTDAPQQWDPNVNPVFEPQYDDYWYPDNNQNNQAAQWQAHDPNQYWPPAHNQYQQPEQRQHIIDWQVFDLNYYDEVPFDYTQHQNLQPQQWQQKTRKIATKQETTEKNYNTFGPEELRDRTSTVNDSINYNTYSDRELKELGGMQEKSRPAEEEYAEYDTAELEEDDSDETRNYNTLDPTSATTKPTKEINYNTYAPEELSSVSQPKYINFNTHGHKPYFHTDPHSAEKLYKEYPITRNLTANKPNDHTPIARQSEYFATAHPPMFDISNYEASMRNRSTPLPRLLDIKVSLTTSTIEQLGMFVPDDDGNTKSEPFLNRWLFGKKNPPKSAQPPSPSSDPSFFESDYRTVESQSRKEGQIPSSLLDLDLSPVTPMIAQEMHDDHNYGSSVSESFLDRWLFGKKLTRKSTRVPSTFDHRSFFASPLTSDHWLLSSHGLQSTSMDSKVLDSNENEQFAPAAHSSEARSRIKISRPIPATPSPDQSEIPDENYESGGPLLPPDDDSITDITTPRITPATPSSSVDGLSRKIKSRTRTRVRHHKHNRTPDHHDQIEVDCTRPMSPQPTDFTSTLINSSLRVTKRKYKRKSTHTDSQLHLNSSNEHSHSRPPNRKRSSNSTKRKAGSRQKRQGISCEHDISSDSDFSSPEENRSNPLDVSNPQDYCAWANQQRYLLSIERRAKADRQNQEYSRRPLFKQISLRKVNPEYMQTPYWTGSTSYVWMDGGQKKKVIDLPDESYGLLIEDSEEWWHQQWREAKSLRAYKYLGLNREGYRKSRLEDQEERKKSKLGRLFGHVKNFFRKITGRTEKENDLKEPDDQEPDHNEERRNWDRTDRRNPNYRPQQRNSPMRSSYRNPNYRHYEHNPDRNYQPNVNYNNPTYGNADPNSNNPPRSSDNQRYYKNNENRRFNNYKPFQQHTHNNPNNPYHRANKPHYRTHYRQADANSVNNNNNNNPQFYHQSTSMYIPPYENSNTRSMD